VGGKCCGFPWNVYSWSGRKKKGGKTKRGAGRETIFFSTIWKNGSSKKGKKREKKRENIAASKKKGGLGNWQFNFPNKSI